MKNGYQTKLELNSITQCKPELFIDLLDHIKTIWTYDSIKTEWFKDFLGDWNMRLTLVTMGWSGNESIVNALLKNATFGLLWYAEWYRGGKHVFEIDPKNVGYKLVSEYCKENGISRQAVSQNKHLYNFVSISKNIQFIKRKNETEYVNN